MAHDIALLNQKGGVGKSGLSTNLGTIYGGTAAACYWRTPIRKAPPEIGS